MKIVEIITALVAKLLPFFLAYRQGKETQENKQTESELENANVIIDIKSSTDDELDSLLDKLDK